ncbi:MAG: SNF2-related protein [Burkholderiales bacterium]|mgnify:CR=1 FL=1
MNTFKLFRRRQGAPKATWHVRESEEGVVVTKSPKGARHLEPMPVLDGWLSQLEDEGFAVPVEDGFYIAWDTLYELRCNRDHADALAMLSLPETVELRPAVSSRGSLEDEGFAIFLDGWSNGPQSVIDATLHGPVIVQGNGRALLPAEAWALVKEIRAFAQRPVDERTGQAHRLAWGRIRRLAIDAKANLDAFLHKTVILTPEKLAIGIRKVQVADDTVIEVRPTFDGAPEDWLARFDRQSSVQARYDIPTPDGIVQVVIGPKVRTVLEEVKRLPGRRVAGVRAQAFILNPYAALGEDANAVIDEKQFEEARAAAGLDYERFLPQFERDSLGYPLKVGLLIETASSAGPSSSESIWLDDVGLAKFVKGLKAALARDFQLFGWEGYDLELQGDTPEHLSQLEEAIEARRQPPVLITYAQVYDLTHYASRVQEIGFEKAYYSPFITKKKDDDGWFPENIVNIISWTPEGQSELVSMPVSPEALAELKQKVAVARATGKTEVQGPGMPKPMPVAEADRITQTFDEARDDAREGNFDPEKPKRNPNGKAVKRKSPVLLSNIAGVDYAEERLQALSAAGRQPDLPASLRPEFSLLPHQREGVAWLQTLFEARKNYICRGAVLADDMGLGKTFQLLTLMAWAIERDPDVEPMLVVAPVSLLENWKEEAAKFFRPGALPVLTAYGDDLANLRVPTASIDARLRTEDGLTKFLRPGWLSDARIVLTTYETLRDLEFSFATQRWSMMVCDEAQKIKNPAAMVTRAAKKQNVAFKIACTGTPVENTLADLWCLFDYIPPGLLGALNDFGRRYRKPIEAKTDGEKARVEELRKLIAPQILRRTKAEVAKGLPRKIVVEPCRKLPLSAKQRELYGRAIELFKRRNEPGANVPFKNHLGLLHYLRLICTDPRRHGVNGFRPEPLAEYRTRAPKLDWLLSELKAIERKGEKAIVFCEFRNIQRLLQYYIQETFCIRPDIINGDTEASASHTHSRQKRIRAFQEKPGFGVIVLSPVAVGFGVNIQAANHVVHYTRTWNPAKEDQATDRAYRIGQTRDVYVYYPVVYADDFTTFDVKLDRLLELKRGLANDMLNGSGELKPGEFRLDDVAPPETPLTDEPVTLETALAMNWEFFEGLATVLYAKRGFDACRTPGTKDNGVDVVALPRADGRGKLVQAKSSASEDAALNWDAVKEVVGGHAFYARQFPKVAFDRVCITNQRFDQQARMNAVLNDVELIEQPQLAQMLKETVVTLREVEQVLYTDWASA